MRSPFLMVLAAIFVVVFAISASIRMGPKGNPPGEFDHAFLDPAPLEVVAVDPWEALRLPRDLSGASESLLIAGNITEPRRQTLWRVLSLPGLNVLAEGSTDPLFSVSSDRRGGHWGYHLSSRSLLPLHPETADTIVLGFSGGAFDPQWLDNKIVAIGRFYEGRFGFFDAAGRLIEQNGPLPHGEPDVPVAVRQMLRRGEVAVSPAGNIAIALYYYPMIELYHPDGSYDRTLRGPYAFAPRYWVRDGALATDVTLRYAYAAVSWGSNSLWALFSGRTREQDPYTASFGRFVHVFPLRGEGFEAFELQGFSTGLVVDERRGCLYSLEATPGPRLVVYQLPAGDNSVRCEVGPR